VPRAELGHELDRPDSVACSLNHAASMGQPFTSTGAVARMCDDGSGSAHPGGGCWAGPFFPFLFFFFLFLLWYFQIQIWIISESEQFSNLTISKFEQF
jgi:hypothetical protein